MKLLKRAANFAVRVAKTVYRKIKDFIKTTYEHIESVVILVLASLGLTALLSEVPFYFTLPLWVEAAFVIPVLSVLIISALVKVAEWRANNRRYDRLAYAA